jgi:hypothetical protein
MRTRTLVQLVAMAGMCLFESSSWAQTASSEVSSLETIDSTAATKTPTAVWIQPAPTFLGLGAFLLGVQDISGSAGVTFALPANLQGVLELSGAGGHLSCHDDSDSCQPFYIFSAAVGVAFRHLLRKDVALFMEPKVMFAYGRLDDGPEACDEFCDIRSHKTFQLSVGLDFGIEVVHGHFYGAAMLGASVGAAFNSKPPLGTLWLPITEGIGFEPGPVLAVDPNFNFLRLGYTF